MIHNQILSVLFGFPHLIEKKTDFLKNQTRFSEKPQVQTCGCTSSAFSSSRQIGGGNETTILNILNAMIIHGMIVQGDWQGGHYGPVSIGFPDARVVKECVRAGSRIAQLIKKLAS